MHTTKNTDKSQQDENYAEAKGWRYIENTDKHFQKKV